MRKKVFGKQLSRGRVSRTALKKSLIRAIVLSGKIKTTKAKVQVVRPELDKIMGLVAANTLQSKKAVLALLGNDKETVKKLWADYGTLAGSRSSGFTKATLLPRRKGDNAQIATLEWVQGPSPEITAKAKTKKIKS
jgi:large subunit ribosomal protein L17